MCLVRPLVVVLAACPLLGGCGDDAVGAAADAVVVRCGPSAPATRTISCVDAFEPGPAAGYGQDRFPEIVYGPPHGGGSHGGSTDVLSLGKGGEIVFGFGGNAIVDGDGPDLLVFENAFDAFGDPTKPFAELGEVSVSEDGETWATFPCRAEAYPFDGCAGWHPVFATPDSGAAVYDPAVAGGDPFDLADVGLASARFVKIRDISNNGVADKAGFDLDAAAIVHAKVP